MKEKTQAKEHDACSAFLFPLKSKETKKKLLMGILIRMTDEDEEEKQKRNKKTPREKRKKQRRDQPRPVLPFTTRLLSRGSSYTNEGKGRE